MVEAKAKDPICGMLVDPQRTPWKGVYDGQPVYFCAEACKKSYEARRRPF